MFFYDVKHSDVLQRSSHVRCYLLTSVAIFWQLHMNVNHSFCGNLLKKVTVPDKTTFHTFFLFSEELFKGNQSDDQLSFR